jgi:hypothetical protein
MNGIRSANPNRLGERALSLAAAFGRIGPIGAAARLVVGTTLIVLALFWRDPHWRDAVRRDDQIGCALFGPIDLLEPERTGVGDPV